MEEVPSDKELCQQDLLKHKDNSASRRGSDGNEDHSFKGWKRFARYDENGKLIREDVPLPPELQEEWDKDMQEWFEDEYSSPEDQKYWRQRFINKYKDEGYCYYIEASGAIEQLFAKNDSWLLPHTFAEDVLHLKLQPAGDDGSHYLRDFGNGKVLAKALYGFKDKNIFEKITDHIMYYAENFGEYDNYEHFREQADKIIALSKKNDASLRSLLEKDEYCVKEILDWAMEFFVTLEYLHFTFNYNEFPEKVFKDAEFMFYIISELGEPRQYGEASAIFERWRAEVTELTLITI